MIIWDTETTGLLGPSALPISEQPYLTEIALMRVDAGLNEVERFHTLIRPPISIPDVTIKINGIDDAMVAKSPSFARIYATLANFFLGEEVMVAHNLPFDRGMLATELQRLDRLLQFPWPSSHLCTAEESESIEGKYLKQQYLYELATGKPANQTHRAMGDVEQLLVVIRYLRKLGLM